MQLSYIRSVAVTKECGDWSVGFGTHIASNEPHPNYGCAIQNNIAAMVVNPDDFVTPRPTTPALAATRTPGVTTTMMPPAGSNFRGNRYSVNSRKYFRYCTKATP